MTNLNNQEWKEQTAQDDNSIILDVRTDDEVSEGMIPNALHYDIFKPQEFMEAVNGMDADKNYYVYCRAGSRSMQACQIMEQLGIKNTFNLTGGFSNWDGDTAMKS
ncbi:rhodanese-like domain-containing protein [Nonlabens sp. Asnod3-A02]|uniref:rhodanese-like domain-containing protein n=1 Tax=Nonlabens sp. Asnod3-A02 TaxID=3160579 RepID=UPI00386E2C69